MSIETPPTPAANANVVDTSEDVELDSIDASKKLLLDPDQEEEEEEVLLRMRSVSPSEEDGGEDTIATEVDEGMEEDHCVVDGLNKSQKGTLR